MTKRLLAVLLLLTGCEGTWATPNQITLHGVGKSNVTGLASASISKQRLRSDAPVGSTIDAQFQRLRDPRPYALAVERGSCAHLRGAITKFDVYPYPDPGEGLESSGHVDVPIHDLMKNGYALALLKKRTGAVVSCGDLQTDRPM
ncbi:MAG TPA: hypothetical protein VFH72_05080 [Candidatus Baltobacteraceae bacterium]|nr:hypothetical protein [Candidatus Baltobacteraceae bacterium]